MKILRVVHRRELRYAHGTLVSRGIENLCNILSGYFALPPFFFIVTFSGLSAGSSFFTASIASAFAIRWRIPPRNGPADDELALCDTSLEFLGAFVGLLCQPSSIRFLMPPFGAMKLYVFGVITLARTIQRLQHTYTFEPNW